MVPAFVALSPGTSLSFRIAGSPATLKDKMLKSPLVAIAETEIRVAAAAARLKRRRAIEALEDPGGYHQVCRQTSWGTYIGKRHREEGSSPEIGILKAVQK
jgi:hypothetical protein